MFRNALREVSAFTAPVAVSRLYHSGEVTAGCGTFFAVNPEGWVLTAAHVLSDIPIHAKHQPLLVAYHSARAAIESDPKLDARQKRKRVDKLGADPTWLVRFSHWWGLDGLRATQWHVDPLADLALVRLDPFPSSGITTFARFCTSAPLEPGLSLCRLGYPFHTIKATWDATTSQFRFAPGTLPFPRFPLDGMYTREAIVQDAATGREVSFVETSSPGLRGQSGGPIFDVEGRVCAVQSQTANFALGFNPKVTVNGKTTEEHQFLNAGLGTHVNTVVAFMRQCNVSFTEA